MRIGSGQHIYEWVDSWAKIPDTESSKKGWAHHGIVVTESGEVIACHQGEATIVVFDKDGNLLRTWGSRLTEAHGITLVKEKDVEFLWIADPGSKRRHDRAYETVIATPNVVKTTLEGSEVMVLESPQHPVYRDGNYRPTWVAVNEERHGGNGDIWVADGYGANYVHRFGKSGNYVSSINGREGDAGEFNCPHSLFVDIRKSEPELYIADRSSGRVQIYDMEGGFKRWFGPGIVSSPSGFAAYGDLLIIIELRSSRIAVLDADDNLVTYLGANPGVSQVGGWPNVNNDMGEPIRTNLLKAGRFNSPHGIAVDGDGDLYVAEWLIGGRFTKLTKT